MGKRHSEETKREMSKSRKGKPKSKEHSLAIAAALRGRHLSEENKRHLSESKKGHVPWNKNKKGYTTCQAQKVNQYDLCGNFIRQFRSSGEAAKILGLSQGNISACCAGKRNQTGGYVWEKAE